MTIRTFNDIDSTLTEIIAAPGFCLLSPTDQKWLKDISTRVSRRIAKNREIFDAHLREIERLETDTQ